MTPSLERELPETTDEKIKRYENEGKIFFRSNAINPDGWYVSKDGFIVFFCDSPEIVRRTLLDAMD